MTEHPWTAGQAAPADQELILSTLEKLVDLPGPSGFEDAVAETVIAALESSGARIETDTLGNVIARDPLQGRPSDTPILMISAHMDEVGLIVSHVAESGALFCRPIGLINERALPGSTVDVWGSRGRRTGVIGVKSRHLMTDEEARRPILVEDLWIDVGARSAAQAMEAGIDVGVPITFARTWDQLEGDQVVSKALDNRAGCAALLAVASRVASLSRDFELVLAFTVQEEIGSRGARVAAENVRPALALVVDTTPAGEWDGAGGRRVGTILGMGPVIRAMDERPGYGGTVYTPAVRRRLEDVAREAGIPSQVDVFPTWTDASGIHLAAEGVAIGGVYIPRRNSHSPVEILALADVLATIELIARFLIDVMATDIADLRRRPAFPLGR